MQLRNIPNKNPFNINKYVIYTRSLKIKLKLRDSSESEFCEIVKSENL